MCLHRLFYRNPANDNHLHRTLHVSLHRMHWLAPTPTRDRGDRRGGRNRSSVMALHRKRPGGNQGLFFKCRGKSCTNALTQAPGKPHQWAAWAASLPQRSAIVRLEMRVECEPVGSGSGPRVLPHRNEPAWRPPAQSLTSNDNELIPGDNIRHRGIFEDAS